MITSKIGEVNMLIGTINKNDKFINAIYFMMVYNAIDKQITYNYNEI